MMKLRGILLPILAVISFFYMSWHVASSTKAVSDVNPPVDPARSPFAARLAGAGIVEPKSENIRIASQVPGVVSEVAVSVGQVVRKGDLLFQLNDEEQAAEVAVLEARMHSARSQLERLQAQPRAEDLPPLEAKVRQAESELAWERDQMKRIEELTERRVTTAQDLTERRQKMASKQAELDLASADLIRLKAGAWTSDIAVARSQLEEARLLYEQALTELRRLETRAPVDGTILKVDVRPGEYVGTPPSQTLIVLGDISQLHVRVDIDEYDLPRLKPGVPGKAYLRGDAEIPLELTFVRIEPFAEPKKSLTGRGDERIDTRVLQAIYAIESTNRVVYVGQQVDVFLEVAK